MTKELFIDLCARLPYDIKIKIPTLQEDTVFTLVGICEDYITVMKDNGSYFDIYTLIDGFPLLRSMSSMTEEEKEKYHELCYSYYGIYFDSIDSIDWLNEKGFDYRGLIQIGLALEAPEGMYK